MSYQIRWGDTLSGLARRFGTTVQALARANGIQDVNRIFAGRTLRIPGRSDSFGAQPAGNTNTGGTRTGGVRENAPSSGNVSSSFGANASRLASAARSVALSMNTTGWCARGVGNALDRIGMSVPRQPSAYMYANVLARDPRFREVRLSQAEMRNLPPGAIIVHPSGYRGAGSPHGHIAVTLGGGREASDHVQTLITSPNARVFIPR